MSRLKEFYKSDVAPELMKKFNYSSPMQIPKLVKVVVNVGAGEAKDNPKELDSIINDLGIITGQKAVATVAKKSVSNFKLRAGSKIGAKVTLRDEMMYIFVDKLFNISLPRVRDFKGLKEQLIFPEIEYDKIDKIRGMDIVFVTSANTDEEAKELLTLLGAPFAKE